MANKYVMVPVLPETKERLTGFGNKGETYDRLVNRLLDEADTTGVHVGVQA